MYDAKALRILNTDFSLLSYMWVSSGFAYLQEGYGDSNDIFRIEAVNEAADEPLVTVHSIFRLVHVNIGCALHSHDKQLPKW